MASEEEPPSGLRNPRAAVRGVGAAAFLMQALVLLLALRPVQQVADASATQLVIIGFLVAGCVAGAGFLRYAWGWWYGIAVQLAVAAAGVAIHWSLIAIAALFGAIWYYVLRVRRVVLAPPHPLRTNSHLDDVTPPT